MADGPLAELFALAWRTAPALEANTAIEAARRASAAGAILEAAAARGDGPALDDPAAVDAWLEERGDAVEPARSYELVVPAAAGWDWFAQDALPKLVYHLESIGAHLPGCAGVVVSLFAGDRLCFVGARELVAYAARRLGVSPEELARRHGTGEVRTALRDGPPGAPLALPAKTEPR